MKTQERVSKAAISVGVVALVVLSVAPSGAQSGVHETVNKALDIRLKQPTVVTIGDNPFEVIIKGLDGRAIDDADITVSFVMSAWPIKRIPETRNHLTLRSAGNGRYMGSWNVALAGPWVTTIVVKKNETTIGRKAFVLTAH
jgi:hypothetical protein